MRKKLNKSLFLSIFFFALFVLVVIANEMNFFKSFTSIEVVVATEVIPKDTVITEDLLTTMEVPKGMETEKMLRHSADVVGKTTTQMLLPSQYISSVYLDNEVLRPTPNHEFFPIPNSWLIDIQGTLRRYDLINISAIYVGKGDNQQVSAAELKAKIQKDHVLKEVPVAYVKTGKNSEVTNVTNDDTRLYGSDTPSDLELSLTLEQFKTLETLYQDGYKLIISY